MPRTAPPAAPFTDPLDERKFVVALARGLDLLRAFRPGETLLGNRDFVECEAAPNSHHNQLTFSLFQLRERVGCRGARGQRGAGGRGNGLVAADAADARVEVDHRAGAAPRRRVAGGWRA